MSLVRPKLSTEDEENLRGRLRMHIDAAQRGNHWAAYEAAKCMAQLGCFDGPHAKSRRSIFARWMDGVHPDVAAQGWAEFIASRGGR